MRLMRRRGAAVRVGPPLGLRARRRRQRAADQVFDFGEGQHHGIREPFVEIFMEKAQLWRHIEAPLGLGLLESLERSADQYIPPIRAASVPAAVPACSEISETRASVVSMSEAIDAAF